MIERKGFILNTSIIIATVVIVTAIMNFIVSPTLGQIHNNKAEIIKLDKQLTANVARLETEVAVHKARIDDIKYDLQMIQQKLDQIIANQSGQ